MANTPTTPASVASRLTDEDVARLAKIIDEDYEWHKRNHVPPLAKNYKNVAAVLRDYVRLRKLAKVRNDCALDEPHCFMSMDAIKNCRAIAEEGDGDGN